MAGTSSILLNATPKAPIAIRMEPLISKGLRPSFSTVKMARRVKVILMIPIKTVYIIGSPRPIDSKMRGAKYSTALMPIAC